MTIALTAGARVLAVAAGVALKYSVSERHPEKEAESADIVKVLGSTSLIAGVLVGRHGVADWCQRWARTRLTHRGWRHRANGCTRRQRAEQQCEGASNVSRHDAAAGIGRRRAPRRNRTTLSPREGRPGGRRRLEQLCEAPGGSREDA